MTYQRLVLALSYDEAKDILGIRGPVTPEAVSKAYKQQAFKVHPDRGGDPQAVVTLNVAKEVLLGVRTRTTRYQSLRTAPG